MHGYISFIHKNSADTSRIACFSCSTRLCQIRQIRHDLSSDVIRTLFLDKTDIKKRMLLSPIESIDPLCPISATIVTSLGLRCLVSVHVAILCSSIYCVDHPFFKRK